VPTFRALTRDDFDLLGSWLGRPHVARWWHHDPSPDAVESDFGPAVDGTDPCEMFVVVDDDRPVGFVQRYRIDDEPAWRECLSVIEVPDAAVGIDYLIGEEERAGQGLGTEMIGAFVARTWQDHPSAPAVIVDVDPDNRASWRALERNGFRRVWTGHLVQPDPDETGPAHIYRLDRPDRAGSGDRAAVGYAAWVAGMVEALDGRSDADVPCDGCTACCRSSQFVHVRPDETDALAHIPAELLFPAPGRPDGHQLMGYDEQGRCPMLVDDRCSIYEHRPRTCRTYDCRVFPATGFDLDDPARAPIAERAARWRFDLSGDEDRVRRGAVRAAARFVRDHGDLLPGGSAPTEPTHMAVLAVELHEAFVDGAGGQGSCRTPADAAEEVRVVLSRRGHGTGAFSS
jgi:RimJ/RimL family protein N-acetyltransferase/Fe-S-cluster containining protein